MNIVVLGDKYKKGKKSEGCPALVSYKKTTIIEYQVHKINKAFNEFKIHYVCGFEKNKLQTFCKNKKLNNDNLVFVENENYHEYGEAFSLSLALDKIQEENNLIISNGYCAEVFNNFHFLSKSNNSMVYISKNKNNIGCIINNNKIENISYELNNYVQNTYFIAKKDYRKIYNLIKDRKNKNCFIFEIINMAIDKGCCFEPYGINKD
jgi:hypothetical protein